MADEQKYNNRDCHLRVDLSIHNAIVFAARKYDKQYRKSTDIPYIAHIMEVMQHTSKEKGRNFIKNDTLKKLNILEEKLFLCLTKFLK